MIETDLVVFLTIHFPTMSDAENSHALVGIIDFIEDSIIPDPYSPVIFGTG
jgi:hypothetical protein